jgi:hypothetical protein
MQHNVMFDLLHTELLSDEQKALGQQYAEQALRACAWDTHRA